MREQCGCWLFEYTVIKPSCFVDISCCVRGLGNSSRKHFKKSPKPAGHKEKITMYTCTVYTSPSQRQVTQRTSPSCSPIFLFTCICDMFCKTGFPRDGHRRWTCNLRGTLDTAAVWRVPKQKYRHFPAEDGDTHEKSKSAEACY